MCKGVAVYRYVTEQVRGTGKAGTRDKMVVHWFWDEGTGAQEKKAEGKKVCSVSREALPRLRVQGDKVLESEEGEAYWDLEKDIVSWK